MGTIKPQGWLKEMLVRQKNGATGNLDKLYPLVMNEQNGWLGGDGPGVDSKEQSVNATNDARHALDVGAPLTQSQADFLYIVDCQGCRELSQSLKMIHDLALYHSDIPFEEPQKSALYDMKLLWEGLEKMGEKV